MLVEGENLFSRELESVGGVVHLFFSSLHEHCSKPTELWPRASILASDNLPLHRRSRPLESISPPSLRTLPTSSLCFWYNCQISILKLHENTKDVTLGWAPVGSRSEER